MQYEIPYPETIKAKDGGRIPFDPAHDASHRRLLQRNIDRWKTNHPEAADATLDMIDEDRRIAVLKDASVASISRNDNGSFRVNLTPDQSKPSKGAEVASVYERRSPGYRMTEFHPYAGWMLMERLDDELTVARGQIAEYLRVNPWDVKVERTREGGLRLTFQKPFVYKEERDGANLQRAAAAVGHEGWWADVDAKNGTATIHPGEPATFPKTVPFPFDRLGDPETRDRMPFAMQPARPGETPAPLLVDWTQSPGLLVAGLSGGGKAQPLDAPIPVPVSERHPDGWATIGSLRVGEHVYTPDGGTAPIVSFSDTVEREIWEMELSDGQTIECAGDHLWNVVDSNARARMSPNLHGREAVKRENSRRRVEETRRQIERLRMAAVAADPDEWGGLYLLSQRDKDVSYSSAARIAVKRGLEKRGRQYNIRDVLNAIADERESMIAPGGPWARKGEVTVTAEWLHAHLADADGQPRWAIHVTEPIDGPELRLPLHPYVLGCWLGDGISRQGGICLNDEDAVFMEPLIEHEGGLTVRRVEDGHHATTRHYTCADGRSLTMLLKDMGLILNKHIPAEYRRGSATQRLLLLQGIMDTDGTIDGNGGCELTLTNPRLAKDALELVRSLGVKATMRESDAMITEPDGTRRKVGRRWRIRFTTTLRVFRLPRKRERLPERVRRTQEWLYVRGVRPTGRRTMMRCIRLASQPHLYLCSGFVTSHNSVSINDVAAFSVASGSEIYVLDHATKATDFYWLRPWVAPHGWGADGLLQTCGLLKWLLDDIEGNGARARAWREHGWQNWYDDLTDEDKLKYPLRTIIVDELSQLAVGGKNATSIPKNPLPAVMERMIEQQIIALNLATLIKLTQVGRAYGYRFIIATQIASSTTGMPPALRGNLGNRLIMGARASDAQKNLVFNDASSVPDVPRNVIDEGVSKGAGMSEFEGQPPCVFKTAFPLLGSHAGTTALGEALVDRVGLPDGFTREEYLDSLDKSTPSNPDYERRIMERIRFRAQDAYRLYPFLSAMRDKLEEVEAEYGGGSVPDDDGGDPPTPIARADDGPDGAEPLPPAEGLMDAAALARVMEGRG